MINIRNFLGLGFYVSAIDKFLAKFNHDSPKLSESQRKEIEKYTKIYALRDHVVPSKPVSTLWDKF